MKSFTAKLFILALTAALSIDAAAQTDWIKYNSPEGGYSVLFPAKPELETQEGSAHTGQDLKQFLAICEDPNPANQIVYIIGYFDLLPNMNYSFDVGRDGILKSANATLISEKPIQFGAYAGRELKASTNRTGTDFVLTVRLILVDRRVFVNQTVIAKSFESARSAELTAKFLDSFALIK